MVDFVVFLQGVLALTVAVIFSVFFLVIKKYSETLAKLSAEDYYKNGIKK